MSTIKEQIKAFPDSPGVYFWKKGSSILYVGKATSLRSRVRSYFSADIASTRGPLIVEMVTLADKIEFEKTDSVLEALILEANLIKKWKPSHNTMLKDDKSWNYVVITKEKFPRVIVIRGRDLEKIMKHGKIMVDGASVKYEFGPFPYGLSLLAAMKIIRRIFPYRDSKCIPKEEQLANWSQKYFSAKKSFDPASPRQAPAVRKLQAFAPSPCWNRQIGLCPGVCTGEISAVEYAKYIQHLKLFFEGKKKTLLRSLEKEMKEYAKGLEFEKAALLRKQMYALQHIQDVSLIKDENKMAPSADFRIESYDIAHISGTSTVGVMTVVEDGEAKKADYRMFRIRKAAKGSDTGALLEVLERRFKHAEWQYPNLIVIDGGVAQKNTAEKFLLSRSLTIPVVSVVKDSHHKPDHFLGDSTLAEQHKSEIILGNSEAHRFAITYHKKVRGRLV